MLKTARRALGAALAMSALLLWAAPAQAQQGIPEFITDCDPDAPLCTQATVTGGSVNIRNTTVDIPEGSVVLRQGQGFLQPDGFYPIYPPPSGNQLQSEEIPAPGLQGLIGITVSQELAGPVTARQRPDGHDVFTLPLTLRVHGPLLGNHCRITPVVVELTTGPTDPPPPNESISGHAATGVEEVPYGDGQSYSLFTGAQLVDNAFSVPKARGCGLLGVMNPVINLTLGLPSPAGHNSMVLNQNLAVHFNL